jgi:hypothetical protein
MIVGAVGLLVAIIVLMHDYKEADPAEKFESEQKRLALVERMRLLLSTAAEAEKSAVMAVTDEESQTFAAQAQTASNAVSESRQELATLLDSGGKQKEIDLFAQFTRALADYQRIEHTILDLAVKNTNLKAYSLAFGPARRSIQEMDAALGSLLEESAGSTDPKARQVMLLAAQAESGALRIQADLAPHIAEASDAKMDSMEATISSEDEKVRKSLDDLSTLVPSDAAGRLQKAHAAYANFTELRTRILDLSRQNTNVRSLMLSLNEKRLVLLNCQDLLLALEQAIRAEARAREAPPNPRKM